MSSRSLRYQLPPKAIKGDCPQCGPRHRKTLSRYVDTRTGETLPTEYGRCDRESNCTYHLSPYAKGPSGSSYADDAFEQYKLDHPLVRIPALKLAKPTLRFAAPVLANPPRAQPSLIPRQLVDRSLSQYENNQLANLLTTQFGIDRARQLLRRFQIGTSTHWPGACIFWYIDEKDRVRGGQVKLLGPDWRTVRYVDGHNVKRTKTNWVHTVMQHRFKRQDRPLPEWLTEYLQHGEPSPCLFGLPQLKTAPIDQPIALVEAPKTALIASAYQPEYIWLATGAKSYLNAQRLAPLRGRQLMLYPDLNAYHDLEGPTGKRIQGWLSKANELRAEGFTVTVSDYLEQIATDEQRAAGLDLADFLLSEPPLLAPTCRATPLALSRLPPPPRPAELDLPEWYTAFNLPWYWDITTSLAHVQWMVLPPGVEEGSPEDCAQQPAT